MKKEKKTECLEESSIDKISSEEDYHKVKARMHSLQRKRSLKNLLLLFLFMSMLATYTIISIFFDWYNLSFRTVCVSLFSASVISLFLIVYFLLTIELFESSYRRKIDEYEASNLQIDVNEDIFDNSIKMSCKYLDQYYSQTKEQAQKGFWATMFVAGFGAILIAGGIITMYFDKTDPTYVTCGAGVITEFIAAIFFYLYNRTVSSMGNYHNKLVLSHNISIALKVAESLPPDSQVETRKKLFRSF